MLDVRPAVCDATPTVPNEKPTTDDRIVLRVGPDGNPKVQLLDARANVTAELPGPGNPAAHH
jgi:hypothetical protein